jgi:dihydroorotase-like cyclic amidohydrolase
VKTGLVDAIATDHAPHGLIDKAVEFGEASNGIIGLQTAVPITLKLVHDGIVSLDRWVESLTLAPEAILSKSPNSPFFGKKLREKVLLTLVDSVTRYSTLAD